MTSNFFIFVHRKMLNSLRLTIIMVIISVILTCPSVYTKPISSFAPPYSSSFPRSPSSLSSPSSSPSFPPSSNRISQTSHCCDRDRELSLINDTKLKMRHSLEMITQPFREVLADNLKSFTDHFHGLIDTARFSTDKILSQSNPSLAKDQRELVNILFQSFSKIIFSDTIGEQSPSSIEIERSVNRFFDAILDKMYSVELPSIPKSSSIPSTLTNCIMNAKHENKDHFGSYPTKIIGQLRKALHVSRTIIQSVELALHVLNQTASINLSESCFESWVRLTACPTCKGVTQSTYCVNYCKNVARGCFAELYELADPWDKFVTALEQMSDVMLQDYNLEYVLSQIHDNINTTIKQATEKKNKLIQACLSPSSSRHARHVHLNHNSTSLHSKMAETHRPSVPSRTMSILVQQQQQQQDQRQNQVINKSPVSSVVENVAQMSPSSMGIPISIDGRNLRAHRLRRFSSPSLFVVLGNFVHELGESKKFFQNIADQMCAVDKNDTDKCWNGASFSRYTKPLVKKSLSGQYANPEVQVAGLSPKFKILIKKLESMGVTITNSIRTIPESPRHEPNDSSPPSLYSDDEDSDDHGSGDGPEDYEDEDGDGKDNHSGGDSRKPSLNEDSEGEDEDEDYEETEEDDGVHGGIGMESDGNKGVHGSGGPDHRIPIDGHENRFDHHDPSLHRGESRPDKTSPSSVSKLISDFHLILLLTCLMTLINYH
ncbi:glypican-5-like [Brevipalpus obovatus]|uniref:glypican-5-like n=1 Tax=Brevipalpus obovatus TaxID=246614 RepID=UPI003D9F7C7E